MSLPMLVCLCHVESSEEENLQETEREVSSLESVLLIILDPVNGDSDPGHTAGKPGHIIRRKVTFRYRLSAVTIAKTRTS